MTREHEDDLLLGEWACLGLLVHRACHGYDLSLRLRVDGDVGRVYSLSRPLTYRALDQLLKRKLILAVREEDGRAGGTRTVYGPSPEGRAMISRWTAAPVDHIRDVRTELLLKLTVKQLLGHDIRALVSAQQELFAPIAQRLRESSNAGGDAVEVWREESSDAVLRFLDRLSRQARDERADI